MKKTTFIIFAFLSALELSAQVDCPQKQLKSIEKEIIRDYINESVKMESFVNDIGIVLVTEESWKDSLTKWEVRVVIDDSFGLDSTCTYATYFSDIIIFKKLTPGYASPNKEISGCWKEFILDRLYHKPTKQKRPMTLTMDGWADGNPILNRDKKQIIHEDSRWHYVDGNRSNNLSSIIKTEQFG